jgi:hypothetical protein
VTPLEVLKAARKRIEKPEAWTTGSLARTFLGFDVGEQHPDACCWCAIGAVYSVPAVVLGARDIAHEAMERALPPGFDAVERFNDNRYTTHADVLALFDRAIASLEAE